MKFSLKELDESCEPNKYPDMDLRPLTWSKAMYEGFFEALKVHGPNFTKIAKEIGSTKLMVNVFFKRYSRRHPYELTYLSPAERQAFPKDIEAEENEPLKGNKTASISKPEIATDPWYGAKYKPPKSHATLEQKK